MMFRSLFKWEISSIRVAAVGNMEMKYSKVSTFFQSIAYIYIGKTEEEGITQNFCETSYG